MRPLTIRLKPWESRKLRQLRDRASSARLLKRVLCLLLSAAGQQAKSIAQITGLSLDAITDIRRRWAKRGLGSLADRPRSGRPPRVTAQYRQELRRALRRGPLACGYIFTVWSVARLNTYLRQRTGLALNPGWLRRVVHAEGFVLGRPKHTLRGKRKETEYRQARRRLQRLKRERCKRTQATSCGTPTPAGSTSCRTWSAAGGSAGTSKP